MLVIPIEGETLILGQIVNQTTQTNLTLRLFVNNITINETTSISDLTECTTPGYSPITCIGANWVISTISNITSATYPMQTFTFTATSLNTTFYGYYLTNGVIAWAENFATPPIIPASGGTLDLTVVISLGPC